MWSSGGKLAEFGGEFFVAAADQDELGVAEALGDFEHGFRALPSEEDQADGLCGIEAEAAAFGFAIDGDGIVKDWAQDHAGGSLNAVLSVALSAGLFDGFVGAADEVLVLIGF